nr:hypothetical protein [Sphingomonas sp.]
MTLLQRMDRFVYATRIDRIIFMKFQPRIFRWLPLLVFAALVAGYVMMARTASSPNRTFLFGWALFYGAYLVATFLRIFGPRFMPTALAPLDERELSVKNRAYALSGVLLVGFAMLGCFYMATESLTGLWHPHRPNDWIALGFGLQAAAILLPTWIASWMQPRPVTDLED